METKWIATLRNLLTSMPSPGVALGVGDDAAVLADGTVITVDMLTEGVDFLLRDHDPRLIGRKALAVNLSDLAAMAAEPVAVVVAVALPRKVPDVFSGEGKSPLVSLCEKLYEGMMPLLEEFEVALIGGDTNTWDGGLVISVTAVGHLTPRGPLLRFGAKAGDRILLTGPVGGSRLGRQFTFMPRIREALFLCQNYEIHAGIDISDSLSLDLARLCEESRVGALVETEKIPVHPDAIRRAETVGRCSPLQHALTDGEDFELILAAPVETAAILIKNQPLEKKWGCRLYDIGEFLPEPGLWLREENGQKAALTPCGYLH